MYQLMPMIGMGDGVDIEENAAVPVDLDPSDFIVEPDEVPVPVVDEDGDPIREEITASEWMFPTALAIQVFSIVPGIAGGLAGFVLASKLSNAKRVKASEVLLAAGTVAAITFGAVFLVRTIDEFE